MIVALHSVPEGFFKKKPPHSNDELLGLVQKAASMGFKAVQIGPLSDLFLLKANAYERFLTFLVWRGTCMLEDSTTLRR